MPQLVRWLALLVAVLFSTLVFSSAQSAQSPVLSPEASLAALRDARPRPSDLRQLTRLLGRGIAPRVTRVESSSPVLGRVEHFWISRLNPPGHVEADAVLRRISRHAYWYVQDGTTANDEGLETAADAFDRQIYPEVRRLVGSESFPGIDNDVRVTIFNGEIPSLAGYVSSNDAYPSSLRPYSNERNLVYLNTRINQVGSDEYLSTLAHELTHLVHWNVNPSEETWAKEGLGFLIPSLVLQNNELPSASFAAVPDVMLTSWSGDGRGTASVTAHYQSAAWFLRYLIDRFGASAATCLLQNDSRGLAVDAPFAGCGYPQASFADLFQDWVIANLAGHRSGPGVAAYGDRAPEEPRTRRLGRETVIDGSVSQFGVSYYELPVGSSRRVEFQGGLTVPIIPTDGPTTDLMQGEMWYSGRGDGALSAMRRRFDLTTARSAGLEFDAWFDTEADYDYAYVLASRDGGLTWQLLDGPSMSQSNPSGSNLGVGYTGRSGSAERADWVHERIDLGDYFGGPVELAFWYVTDDAVSGAGVALRNIRVDGASDSGQDWASSGWTRVGPLLPQVWSVQMVDWTGDTVTSRRIPVDGNGRATLISRGTGDRTVVAISGLTPVTLERAGFHLEIFPD